MRAPVTRAPQFFVTFGQFRGQTTLIRFHLFIFPHPDGTVADAAEYEAQD